MFQHVQYNLKLNIELLFYIITFLMFI